MLHDLERFPFMIVLVQSITHCVINTEQFVTQCSLLNKRSGLKDCTFVTWEGLKF